MKINRITIGDQDFPILEFFNDSILEITEDTSVSMVGAELAIDQFVPIVKYDLVIRYVLTPHTLDKYQRFLTADGFILTGNYNYDIRLIPYGTPVRFYINNRPSGLYYMSKVDRIERDTFKLSCISAVGMMDKQRHIGNVYTGERFDHVLAEIIGEGYEYIVDTDVAEVQVYGWLPYGTKRSSLHQLLVAFGVTITKSDTGGMLFTFMKATDSEDIPLERVYDEGSVVYGEEASRVEILEHGFYYLGNVDDQVLFDTRGEAVFNTVVVFKQPIYKDSIYVEEGGSMEVLEYGTNYAIVTGAGVLLGKPYIHTTKLIVATNDEAPTEKIVSVEDATLITLANSENCLKRISEFYFRATTVKNSIVVETEKTGKRYIFQNPFRELTSAFMVNMSAFTSNVTKAECEFIQDYVPVAQGSSFLRREILELSDAGALWNIPESVYEKDVPQIRVVLIGAGYDGANGENGQRGQDGTDYEGGEGGLGGLGGKGGAGGRILSATINVQNLAFIRYGSIGKNTWVSAGSTYYNSANGLSSSTGFVEMFTGAVYGLPGNSGTDGAPGGKGGSYPPIAAIGTLNEKAQPGGDMDFKGTKYKGGAGADRKIINGADAGIHPNMNVYFGGCGGGGAAPGNDGDPGTTGIWYDPIDPEAKPSGWVWCRGGRGGNARDALPTTPMYGNGGNGGSGGGGGGGGSNEHWWNAAYTTLISMLHDPGGPGGNGSKGTPGYKGCLIIYY